MKSNQLSCADGQAGILLLNQIKCYFLKKLFIINEYNVKPLLPTNPQMDLLFRNDISTQNTSLQIVSSVSFVQALCILQSCYALTSHTSPSGTPRRMA